MTQATSATIVGDWVQATVDVEETLPDGDVHLHAETGGVGHVLRVDGEWFTIHWERAGTITDTHKDEFKRLGDASTGRFPIR